MRSEARLSRVSLSDCVVSVYASSGCEAALHIHVATDEEIEDVERMNCADFNKLLKPVVPERFRGAPF